MQVSYVSHPLIKPNSVESRLYQESIVKKALEKNILCVLPTGLGKTNIALLVAANRMESIPGSKLLVMAPTKPLTHQHYMTFMNLLNVEKNEFEIVTGFIKPSLRRRIYQEKSMIFATPQTIKNDLIEGRISLKQFSLIVLDEAHHAIGGYAYPYIAKKYLHEADNPRILCLTASPGGTYEKIREIYKNLGIEAVEIKTEADADVFPYVKEKDTEWVEVELPESFLRIRTLLKQAKEEKLNGLKRFGVTKPTRLISKKDLLDIQARFSKSIKQGNSSAFSGISIVSQALKIEHALGLLESQGISMLENYWKKLMEDKSKGAQRLLAERVISNAVYLTRKLAESGSKHPKVSKLCSIISEELNNNPESKIIVFANYRESVSEIVSVLKNVEGANPIYLIGQKSGLTQKEQVETIRRFEYGEYNILVGTSISEEGLHISSADVAIFYEPVPSEIRSIQRRGRVGRTKIGRIVILVTKGTRDEAYKWSAYHKEKRMRRVLHAMQYSGEKQSEVDEFMQ